MKSRLKQVLASTLVAAMLVVPVGATEVSTANTGGTVPVQVTSEAALFSVVVPTGLPVSVDAQGAVTVATNAAIQNNSVAPVTVSGVSVTGQNGWEISAYGTDYSSSELGLKEVGLSLNGDNTSGPGALTLTPASWPSANSGGTIGIVYSATVAPQSVAVNQQIAAVVFTVDWTEVWANTEPSVPTTRSGFIDKNKLTPVLMADTVTGEISFNKQAYSADLAPAGATVTDVSELQDGSVMAVSEGTNVKVYGSNIYAPEDSSNMLYATQAQTIDVSGLDTRYTTSMVGLFGADLPSGPSNLQNIWGLNKLDTSNVTDMSALFAYNSNLKSVSDIESWDTSKVTNMASTFAGLSSLSGSLDLSHWDVSSVQIMVGTFNGIGPVQLNTSGWNTANVTTTARMFYGSQMSSIDLSHLNLSKNTDTNSMFYICKASSVVLPNSGMQAVQSAKNMFNGCFNLTSVNLRGLPIAELGAKNAIGGIFGSSSVTSVVVDSAEDKEALVSLGFTGSYITVSPAG